MCNHRINWRICLAGKAPPARHQKVGQGQGATEDGGPGVAATQVVVRRQREDDVKEVTATVGAGVDLNAYILLFFCPEMLSAFYVCCIYSDSLETNFITRVNTMNPDQTAPKGAV